MFCGRDAVVLNVKALAGAMRRIAITAPIPTFNKNVFPAIIFSLISDFIVFSIG